MQYSGYRKAELHDLLNDLSTRVSTDLALDVTAKQLLVKQKQLALEDARLDVEEASKAVADARFDLENVKLDVKDAQHDVDEAELDVADAEKALENAQEKLEEANSKSPLIVAPFDGFITKVNVEGGDDVMTGTVAVQLADPNKFEAEIMVSEMDIMQIKEGGEARVQVDALSGLTLPAEVTHISPTSTISQGVVNYKVKVEVASLEEMMQERQAAWQGAMQGTESSGLPDRMKEAIAAGRVTQEQVEEILKQRQEMPASIQATAAMSENLQLKEGLTVTVTIVVDQRTDVLFVPNGAITRRGMEIYVQVAKDGATEERAIQTGISDWQYTEVTDGLSEGEQLLVPQGTAAVSATGESRRPQGAMFFGPPPRG